jgi:hypothetical protein
MAAPNWPMRTSEPLQTFELLFNAHNLAFTM